MSIIDSYGQFQQKDASYYPAWSVLNWFEEHKLEFNMFPLPSICNFNICNFSWLISETFWMVMETQLFLHETKIEKIINNYRFYENC